MTHVHGERRVMNSGMEEVITLNACIGLEERQTREVATHVRDEVRVADREYGNHNIRERQFTMRRWPTRNYGSVVGGSRGSYWPRTGRARI